jgi:hypothetical protein
MDVKRTLFFKSVHLKKNHLRKIEFFKKYQFVSFGFIFSLLGLISKVVILVPLLSMILSIFLELFFSLFFNSQDFKKTGFSVIISLSILFLAATYLMLKKINQQKLKTKYLVWYFTFQIFIIPPFCFYLQISNNWNSASDGQFIFGIIEVFPLSTALFIGLGIFFEIFKIMRIKKNKIEI